MIDMPTGYIAIDLGAESGRVIIGVLDDDRLRLEEVHRFTHEPVWLPTGLHWDITGIWREIVRGLRQAADWSKANKIELISVGADTWGVDWALLDKFGELQGLPHAYRDPRNQAAYEEVLAKLGADRIYRTTGIQFMPLNTLYSLYAHHMASGYDAIAASKMRRLQFIPDLIHYWLSGNNTIESTIASTSQMIDCHTGDWAEEMLADLGLPAPELAPYTFPGTEIGVLRKKLAEDTGLSPSTRVVAPAAHDTASAVAAAPAVDGTKWCYLSSGTWSLLGAELAAPCVTPAAQAASFTNERGVADTIRFLKNIAGLWLVQECKRDLSRAGQEFDYEKLTRHANEASPLRTLVNPDHASFQSPGGMLKKVVDFAQATNQLAPESPGQFVRCALESLALAYREKLETLESILERRFDVVHVVGGGGKNTLLSQMTADATGRRVVVGPYEATAMGNALVQAMAHGGVRDLKHLREVAANSSALVTYESKSGADWPAAFDRYRALRSHA